jgi:hypothetical protein
MVTWPQITWLGLMAFGLLIAAAKDGRPRSNYSIGETIIATGISFGILWAGGFWHALGWQ